MAPEIEILGLVDHPHAASADGLEDAVVRDDLALEERREGLGFVGSHGLGHDRDGRGVQNTLRGGAMTEERLHFLDEAEIAATSRLEERLAPVVGQDRSGVIEILDRLPARGLHGDISWLSSRRSHVLASFQSRITVSSDTRRAAAVSSTVRPPKKRSSTTSLLRGSTAANRFRASSTATSSDPTTCDTVTASSNSICGIWPPLF